jgi:hypothetical protein
LLAAARPRCLSHFQYFVHTARGGGVDASRRDAKSDWCRKTGNATVDSTQIVVRAPEFRQKPPRESSWATRLPESNEVADGNMFVPRFDKAPRIRLKS